MQRVAPDNPGPEQDMAQETIKWATELYRQGNMLTADTYAKKAATDKAPDRERKKAME